MHVIIAGLLVFFIFTSNLSGEPMKHVFKNGLVLIHNEAKPLPIVSIKLFINLGSINETEQNSGITHLTQTLILKGTKKRTAEQIALEIESVGGSISSGSDEDYSEISISITKDYFIKALDILSDVFNNPTFPEEELQKEKMMTLAGIKSRKDHIFNIAYDSLILNLYGKHPYARLTIGAESSVQNITRKDIINWHHKYYGVPNVLIVIAGDVSFETAEEQVNKYFSGIPGVEQSKLNVPVLQPELKVSAETTKFAQAYLMYGFLTPSVNSEEYPAMKTLNAYLGGGMSSRLFQVLRESAGLGYEISSFYPSRKDVSRFVIYLGLDKQSLEKAKEKIENLLKEVREVNIDGKRLDEVKEHLRGTYLLDHQTNDRQAWYLGWWEIIGKGYAYDREYIAGIDKVTVEDLKKIAEKYFTDKRVIIQLSPE